jgi:hypothetical protein
MILRDQAIDELKQRLKDNKDVLPLKTVRHLPTTAFKEDEFNALAIFEGDDDIVQSGKNRNHSYPATREFIVALEIWAASREEVKALYRAVRNLVFNAPFASGVSFTERKAHGPYNHGVPKTYGMQMMLVMKYIDSGPDAA